LSKVSVMTVMTYAMGSRPADSGAGFLCDAAQH